MKIWTTRLVLSTPVYTKVKLITLWYTTTRHEEYFNHIGIRIGSIFNLGIRGCKTQHLFLGIIMDVSVGLKSTIYSELQINIHKLTK